MPLEKTRVARSNLFDRVSLRTREGIEVNEEFGTDTSLPIPCARITPFARVRNQAPADGILVNVLDSLVDRRRRGHISIIAATCLPEVIRRSLLSRGQPFQSFRPVLSEIDQRLARDRLLDCTQYLGDRICLLARANQNMDVLRHEYICPEIKRMLCLRSDNGIDQIAACPFALREWTTAETTEGQLVSIPCEVVTVTPLTMVLSDLHAIIVLKNAPSNKFGGATQSL